MRSIAYRDLGDARGVVYYEYTGALAEMPGQPAHVRRRVAALRELRGLGMCAVYVTSGRRRLRRIFRRGW